MIKTEWKKTIFSIEFLIAVLLLYIVFLCGKGGQELTGEDTLSILRVLLGRLRHRQMVSEMEEWAVPHMLGIWWDNIYLPMVAPVIFGLPFISKYVEEVKSQNKRLILIRTGFSGYYRAKVVSVLLTGCLIAFFAVLLYDATLFLFFERISALDKEERELCYSLVSEHVTSYAGVCLTVLKSNLHFMLYGMICEAEIFLLTVLSRDRYITLGTSILTTYIQCRLVQELSTKGFEEQNEFLQKLSQFFSPVFLGYAGRYGIYQNREWAAVLVAGGVIGFCFLMVFIYYKKQSDISER